MKNITSPDIIFKEALDNTNPNVFVIMNKHQIVSAIQFNKDNLDKVDILLNNSNEKWIKNNRNGYKIALFGGNFIQIKETDWIIKYEDKSLGLIDDNEFKNTYFLIDSSSLIHKFQKKLIISTAMSANQVSDALLCWLKEGKCHFEIIKTGIKIATKESFDFDGKLVHDQLQLIKWNDDIFIKKDTSGNFYPISLNTLLNHIILSEKEIRELKKLKDQQ